MAQMINNIAENATRRDGERLVFQWFSDDNIPGVAFYSLLQKNRTRKLIGEVDFLYISERGFLCIEVKGGQVLREGGKWFSIDKGGKKHDIANPFVQAIEAQNALKRHIEDTYGKNSKQAKYLFGYAVIFPECRFTGKGNDLVTEVVYDTKYKLDEFPAYISKVYDYWENEEYEKHGVIKQKLAAADIKQAKDLLCGDFYAIPSMSLEIQTAEKQMHELTEEQFRVLEAMNYNSRFIILGAAGTGKSVLALQLARKYAAKNEKVLYLCYNANMAKYANTSLENHSNIKVSTFHALLMNLLDDNTIYDMSVSEISNYFFEHGLVIKEKFSVIIIDEGQDLLNFDAFRVINELLDGGLSKGIWSIFLDPNQNIFMSDDDCEETLNMLKNDYHAMVLPLSVNCRNTKTIAEQTAVVSCTEPASIRKLEGRKVTVKSYTDKENFIELFSKEINSLLSYGASAKDIVILSRYRKENSLLSDITKICKRDIVERNGVGILNNDCLNYYTVQSFKGLESKFVFYIDVDGFKEKKDRRYNYIAMSRAKNRLYLFYDKSKQQEYFDAVGKGIELLNSGC